jgi:hypothetical protein
LQRDNRNLFHYSFAAHEDEAELCALEQRRLLGAEAGAYGLLSATDIGPSRSPFVKTQLSVICEAPGLAGLAELLADVKLQDGESFKVVCVKNTGEMTYEDYRAAERLLGSRIRGKADMRRPQRLFGAAEMNDGRWAFGDLRLNEAVWLRHNDKPRQYSTALGTRLARAVANIAVPAPEGVRAIDPCCGIGTVLLEAQSMGIDITGGDINPLAVQGARINLAHFGYDTLVKLADMRTLRERYDTAILDLPYNLCSVLPPDTLREMLASLRAMAGSAVIVTTEDIDAPLGGAGFAVTDSCVVRKGSFIRRVLVCE